VEVPLAQESVELVLMKKDEGHVEGDGCGMQLEWRVVG